MKEFKNSIVIQSRMGSKRLPGKSNLKIKNKSILEWVISTAKSVSNVDQIILVTSEERNCDCLVDIAQSEDIAYIRGSEDNVLSRFVKAIEIFKIENCIRITGDDLCHDPSLIEIGLQSFILQECDYLISSTDDFPLLDGLIFEIFTSNLILDTFYNRKLDHHDTEHVTKYIRDKKINYKQGFIETKKIPKEYRFRNSVKLCIDEKVDYLKIKDCWAEKKNNKDIRIADTKKIINNLLYFKN